MTISQHAKHVIAPEEREILLQAARDITSQLLALTKDIHKDIIYIYSHTAPQGRLIKYFREQITYTSGKYLRDFNYTLDCNYVTATTLHNININMSDDNQSRSQKLPTHCHLKESTNNACVYHRLFEIYTEYIETESCIY